MSFGKRPSTLASAPATTTQPDPHGCSKVFPDEVWDGAHGEMLCMLGMNPDDESNLVPNASSINAAIERSKAAHDLAFAEAQARVRSTMPSAQIRPFSLVPDVVWNSPAGVFLMTTLELYPYDQWNIMYLAADERTAMVLDLAPHPGKDVSAFVQASQQFMETAQAHMDKVRARIAQTENWAAFAELQDDMRERVKTMAALFARQIAEAWAENGPARGGRAH